MDKETLALANDQKLQKLLGELVQIMNDRGTLSPSTREFILQHKDVPEFESLATTLVFLKRAGETGPLSRRKKS